LERKDMRVGYVLSSENLYQHIFEQMKADRMLRPEESTMCRV
jgi:hypothetical protein